MKHIDIGIGTVGIAQSVEEQLPPSGPDVVLLAHTMNGEVALDREIAGITTFSAAMAKRTLSCDYPLLCGCGTRFGALRHMSVLTFSGGRLADIADRTLNLGGGAYCEGDTIKVLRLKKFNLGILVDTDILLAKNWKRLAPQCDAVVGLSRTADDKDYAYVPLLASLFCKPFAVAFSSGDILWGTPKE